MTELRLADHCAQLLAAMAERDPRIWVLDGDLADSDGAEHFAARHPERFIAAGIAEQNMVSMAAGMAEAGLRPFVFSFAAFLCFRAYDQIRVGLSQCRQPVTLVGSHSGGLSARNGKTHAALNDLALLLSLPNLRVFCPADVPDLAFALAELAQRPAPAYLRLPRRVVSASDQLAGAPASFRWLGRPARVAIVSTGLATHWARALAERLCASGNDIGVLHWLEPTDDAIAPTLAGLMQAVVVDDHCHFGGLASRVQQLAPRLRVTAFTWPKHWSGQSGSDEALLAAAGLDHDSLSRAVSELLNEC